jgi:hypothetical protein
MKRWKKISFLLFFLFLLIILPTVITNLEGLDNQSTCQPTGLIPGQGPYNRIKKLCESQSCRETSVKMKWQCPESGCKVLDAITGIWHCCEADEEGGEQCCKDADPCESNTPPPLEYTYYKPYCNAGDYAIKTISNSTSDEFGDTKQRTTWSSCRICEGNIDNCRAWNNGKHGYDENGYDETGYDEKGYDEKGYDDKAYDEKGYDEKGYDENGYDENGYDEKCSHVHIPNAGGYDRQNYDKGTHGSNNKGRKIPKPFMAVFIP